MAFFCACRVGVPRGKDESLKMERTAKLSGTRRLVVAAFFLALGLLLPFLTAQVPEIGSKLLPMHIPVLLCGFVCGWPYGLAVGAVLPLFRSLLFGMPPLFPTAVAMCVELAVYGLMTGLLRDLLPRRPVMLYANLALSMLAGRAVWGVASIGLYAIAGNPFTWQIFAAGAFVNALPGIVLQLVIIPPLVLALDRVVSYRHD